MQVRTAIDWQAARRRRGVTIVHSARAAGQRREKIMQTAWILLLTVFVAAPTWAAVVPATAASSHVGQ